MGSNWAQLTWHMHKARGKRALPEAGRRAFLAGYAAGRDASTSACDLLMRLAGQLHTRHFGIRRTSAFDLPFSNRGIQTILSSSDGTLPGIPGAFWPTP